MIFSHSYPFFVCLFALNVLFIFLFSISVFFFYLESTLVFFCLLPPSSNTHEKNKTFNNNPNTLRWVSVGSLFILICFRLKFYPLWFVGCVHVTFGNEDQVLEEGACISPLDSCQLDGVRRFIELMKTRLNAQTSHPTPPITAPPHPSPKSISVSNVVYHQNRYEHKSFTKIII